ncbi:hypothetical protein V1509DRAFT_613077 [Lipomyces kononenkoae]
MPQKLKDRFLSLAVDNISKLDTSDAENLFSIWTVFSKCAENLENGRRLENLSWRLWNREAFTVNPSVPAESTCPDLSSSVESALSDQQHKPSSRQQQPIRKSSTTYRFQKVIETFNLTEEDSWQALRSERLRQLQQKQQQQQQQEVANNHHLAPNQPHPPTESVSPDAQEEKSAAIDMHIQNDPRSSRPAYDYSEDSSESDSDRGRLSRATPSSTSIVRGFSPSAISVHSVRSELFMAAPRSQPRHVSKNSDAANGFAARVAARNAAGAKTKMFFIESSPSESDGFGESVSPAGNGMVAPAPPAPAPAPANGHPPSSNLRSSFSAKKPPPPAASSAFNANGGGHKRTSFREEVVTIPSSGEVEDDDDDDIEDDDDDEDEDEDDVSESAIDDAESDWDSVDESGPPSFDERSFFIREDRPVIRSRPSLLSTLLHTEPDRATLTTVGSRSTPAIAATYAQRQNSSRSSKIQQQLLLQQQQQQQQQSRRASVPVPQPPQPAAEHTVPSERSQTNGEEPSKPTTEPVGVPTVSSAASISSKSQPTLSPRSTRRNMLATELSESLRRNLLWERQQKSMTAAALLKRRHTSQDVANLTHYPELSRGVAGGSYGDRHEFDHTEFGYHARGW